MRGITFFDVDTQYDFMNKKGKLYILDSNKIIPNLRRLIKFAQKKNILVASSLDSHIIGDPEFRQFPSHCLEGSKGQEKIASTLLRKKVIIENKKYKVGTLRKKIKGILQIILKKQKIDVFSNPNLKLILEGIKAAYVFGVALDYCVKSACLSLSKLGIKVFLVQDATKAVSIKGKEETLRLLKEEGVILVSTLKVIKRLANTK